MGYSPFALSSKLDSDLTRVFPTLGFSTPGVGDERIIAALSLRSSLLKKFNGGVKLPDADEKALNLFSEVNKSLTKLDLTPTRMFHDYLIGEVRSSLYRSLGDLCTTSIEEVFDHSTCGPGASINVTGNDLYSKLFSSRGSCTSLELYRAYKHCAARFPLWKEAEDLRFSSYGAPNVVECSRLSCVPKSSEISRTICTEPSLNMFFQLGLGRLIERQILRHYGVDLSSQPDKNRELARIGSLSDLFSTIDLKSASDSISLQLVDLLIPRGLKGFLLSFRSGSTRLPDGTIHKLNMLSTMGNGYTFPLMTIIFLAIVEAVYRLTDYRLDKPFGENLGNFGVFGDDIIVEKSRASLVISALEFFGFVVNREKSFLEGPFKESCGSDFYNGYPVRGIYIKSLETPQDRLVAFNLLARWSALHNIPLWSTLTYLLEHIPKVYVPPFEGLDAGIHVPLIVFRLTDSNGSYIYRKFDPIPRTFDVSDGIVKIRRGMKRRIYNPCGLYLSLLNGRVRNGLIGVRNDTLKYRVVKRVTPFWGHVLRDPWLSTTEGWHRWDAMLRAAVMQ